MKINKKKFIYLISPNKILNSFYNDLKLVLKTKKVSFFQLRLKNYSLKKKIIIGKKIKNICKKNKVKFIINDDPLLALKLDADGCHLGQKDMNIKIAKKILGKKIIGITVCFDEFKNTMYDETSNARITAKKFGIEHHILRVSKEDFKKWQDKLVLCKKTDQTAKILSMARSMYKEKKLPKSLIKNLKFIDVET